MNKLTVESFGAEPFGFPMAIQKYNNYDIQNSNFACGIVLVRRLVSLREEHGLRVFGNRVLRIILGTKWDKVIGEWRRLHKEEKDALYCIPNIIWVIKSRRMRWAEHVACNGDMKGAYNVLVVRPEGKSPLGRSRLRWENNIKMDFQEGGLAGTDWIDQASG